MEPCLDCQEKVSSVAYLLIVLLQNILSPLYQFYCVIHRAKSSPGKNTEHAFLGMLWQIPPCKSLFSTESEDV